MPKEKWFIPQCWRNVGNLPQVCCDHPYTTPPTPPLGHPIQQIQPGSNKIVCIFYSSEKRESLWLPPRPRVKDLTKASFGLHKAGLRAKSLSLLTVFFLSFFSLSYGLPLLNALLFKPRTQSPTRGQTRMWAGLLVCWSFGENLTRHLKESMSFIEPIAQCSCPVPLRLMVFTSLSATLCECFAIIVSCFIIFLCRYTVQTTTLWWKSGD